MELGDPGWVTGSGTRVPRARAHVSGWEYKSVLILYAARALPRGSIKVAYGYLTGGNGTDTPAPGYKGGLDLFVVANDMAIRGLNARSMKALLTDLEAADAVGLPKKHRNLRKWDADAV